MKDESIYEVNNLTEFVESVKEINEEFGTVWFRGHENSSYTLTPSIYRPPFESEQESDFLIQFKSKSIPYLSKSFIARNDFEWFFLMQHYGIPTRLLDWTSSAITALAFAIFFRDDSDVDAKHYNKDIDIWCLNPLKINGLAGIRETEKVPSIAENNQIQELYKTKGNALNYPVAVFGPLINDRIVSQKGVFTLHPSSNNSTVLEHDERADEFLRKISIQGQANIDALRKELSVIGISETSLYPDLEHLLLELRHEFVNN